MKDYLKSFNILTEEEIELALQVGRTRIIRKNDFFIREGQVCKEVAFVKSGFFRSFYHNGDVEEITYCFNFSDSFITAYSSFISQEKSVENICAMADSEILCIARDELLRLEQSSVNWLRLGKLMAEQEYMKMERRVFLLLKENAENKYKDLLHHHPEYLQQIPLNYLASYLGITQRHLSRIRKLITN
jgi:CRP-like cAMP-binding protein